MRGEGEREGAETSLRLLAGARKLVYLGGAGHGVRGRGRGGGEDGRGRGRGWGH